MKGAGNNDGGTIVCFFSKEAGQSSVDYLDGVVKPTLMVDTISKEAIDVDHACGSPNAGSPIRIPEFVYIIARALTDEETAFAERRLTECLGARRQGGKIYINGGSFGQRRQPHIC